MPKKVITRRQRKAAEAKRLQEETKNGNKSVSTQTAQKYCAPNLTTSPSPTSCKPTIKITTVLEVFEKPNMNKQEPPMAATDVAKTELIAPSQTQDNSKEAANLAQHECGCTYCTCCGSNLEFELCQECVAGTDTSKFEMKDDEVDVELDDDDERVVESDEISNDNGSLEMMELLQNFTQSRKDQREMLKKLKDKKNCVHNVIMQEFHRSVKDTRNQLNPTIAYQKLHESIGVPVELPNKIDRTETVPDAASCSSQQVHETLQTLEKIVAEMATEIPQPAQIVDDTGYLILNGTDEQMHQQINKLALHNVHLKYVIPLKEPPYNKIEGQLNELIQRRDEIIKRMHNKPIATTNEQTFKLAKYDLEQK